jgi:hypothetical protein
MTISGEGPIQSIDYFYSAETAVYWNGTVDRGYFCFNYTGDYEDASFEAPDGSADDGLFISDVRNIDVSSMNATYHVTIDTGYRYHRVSPYDLFLTLAIIGIVGLVSTIFIFTRLVRKG